jgi:hypothetical protein
MDELGLFSFVHVFRGNLKLFACFFQVYT